MIIDDETRARSCDDHVQELEIERSENTRIHLIKVNEMKCRDILLKYEK